MFNDKSTGRRFLFSLSLYFIVFTSIIEVYIFVFVPLYFNILYRERQKVFIATVKKKQKKNRNGVPPSVRFGPFVLLRNIDDNK